MKNHIIWVLTILMLPTAIWPQSIGYIDEIAPFSEGLAAVRKGNQWGFINEEGTLVIDFRNDLYWNKDADTSKLDVSGIKFPIFKEGRCVITKNIEEDVPVYGFIDTKGNVVIEPRFLNVYPFKDGYTTAVLFEKTFRGNNEFQLRIYEFKFHDVLLDTSGHVDEYFEKRDHIQMTRKRYRMPWIGAKRIANGLVAVHIQDKGWEIRKITLKD